MVAQVLVFGGRHTECATAIRMYALPNHPLQLTVRLFQHRARQVARDEVTEHGIVQKHGSLESLPMARHTPVRLRQPSAHRHGHRVCRGRDGPERNLVGFSEDILRSEVDADQGEHRYGDKCERYAFDPDHESVRLLPVPYVRAYRRRNKTDRADCMAMLEADRNPEILSVPVKGVDAQAIQGLHRARSAWMGCRTARINTLRGLLREFGVILPLGAQAALTQMAAAIDDPAVPDLLKITLLELLAEVHDLDDKIARVERQLASVARQTPAVRLLQDIPGIGLLTSTALYASAGDAKHFRSGRHLASWLGLTPKEHSSGSRRHLGGISKRGDKYVRTLLIHGARTVLLGARRNENAGRPLSPLQQWALGVQARSNHNKAACAVANKLARIAWASWANGTCFDANYQAIAA